MTCARDEASPALDYGGPVDLPFELFADSVLDGSIIDRFDAIVRRFASRLAIQDDSRSLTYADLAGLVDRIAGVTAGATAGRTGPVALLLANDARYPAAMLGVLAAGRAYIPLDPENPIERNVLITTRSGAAALISAGALANDCRTEFPHDLPVIDVEAMSRGPQADRQVRPRPNDVAHIVYTSGSTGAPKGAFHDHRSCLHEVLQTTNKLHLGPVDRLALFYPPTVMGGIRTTYAALLNGASLHILPARTLGPAGLLQATRSRRITVYRSVPSLFRRIVEALEPDQQLDDLRAVYLAGDQFGWSDVDAFRRGSSRNVFIGIGVGSTECPSNYIQWFIDDKYREADARLPIGWPVPDQTVTIVDADGHQVVDGEVGEFVVASRYLALGYWREPELTAHAFAVDPADPEGRIFRTGDMGRRRPDGLFEFVGRKDQQIKLHGHRIEPAEIESALTALRDVRDAAVVIRYSEAGLPLAIVSYVVLRPGIRGLLPRHLQSILAQRLPRHMVPSQIMLVGDLPRLPNFKIDRQQLAHLDAEQSIRPRDHLVEPLINEIAGIIEAVLGVSNATADDNVASLGGDSLQEVSAMAELERQYAMRIPADVIEQRLTIRQIADWVASQKTHDVRVRVI